MRRTSYIGAGDPNEGVIQTTDLVVDGSIYIVNNGRLDVQGATLTVRGDVFVYNTGTLIVQGGTLRFEQSYSYHRMLLAGESATLAFTDAIVDTGGPFAYNVALLGNAAAVFTRVEVLPGGEATWGFWEAGSLVMTDCTNGDEFVPIGTGNITISGTDSLIFWLGLPDGSVVDTTLPPAGTVASWSVGPSTPWASGIPYTASIVDCTNVIWGVMARSGCDATFRDSTLRAVGSYFDRSNTVSIKGLANNASFADTSFAWGDVVLRFVNSSVQS